MHQLVRRLERIHALHEREQQAKLAGIEARRAAAGRELEVLVERLDALRVVDSQDVSDLARRHLYQVQMEMVRRRGEEDLATLDDDAEQAREAFKAARRTTRTTGKLAEKLEAKVAEEVGRQEARDLDELAAMAWWSAHGGTR